MIYKNFDQLIAKVGKSEKKKVVLAAAHDEHALEAVLGASKAGTVDYVLVGVPEKILEIGGALGYEIDPASIVPSGGDEDSAFKAVEQIRLGKGDFLMKGRLQTATLLKAVVNRDTGIRTGRTMTHTAIVEIPGYHKLVGLTDAGMVIAPDLEGKRHIVENAVELFQGLGVENPKVAMLCAVETLNPKMQATVDAAELKRLNETGEIKDCFIEGPISFDLSMSREIAAIKGYESPVVGDVDILVAPDLTAGNIMVKALLLMAHAKMAGCIIGAKVPIVLTSRGASAEEKYLSLALCAASVDNKQVEEKR